MIFSGGPASVYEPNAPTIDRKIFAIKILILGICYGWQLIAHLLGGKVIPSHKEYGPANLKININRPLFSGVNSFSKVWVSHGDTVVKTPANFVILGKTETVKNAACADFDRKIMVCCFIQKLNIHNVATKFYLILLKIFVIYR